MQGSRSIKLHKIQILNKVKVAEKCPSVQYLNKCTAGWTEVKVISVTTKDITIY